MARPTVYKDTYPEELISLMEKGKLDVQIYAKWDICKDTFYTWLNEKPELREAHNLGMAKCEAFYITKAQESIEVGDDKGFKYYISLMNNKFGWEKGSKGDSTTNNINIGNMSVLQHMSRENLLDHIKTSINKNKDVIDVEFMEIKHE